MTDNQPAASEERAHHPFSPSTLQSLEACPPFQSRQSAVLHPRTVAGTRGHKAVETETDDLKLSDDDAAAAAECLDFVESRRRLLQEAADKARFAAGLGENTNILGLPEAFQVLELKETHLAVDDLDTTAGYPDHVLVNHDRTYGEIIDYKFGIWEVEKADNNLQAIAYSLGLFRMFPRLESVRFWFRQPIAKYYTDTVFTRAQVPELYLRVQVVVARAKEARKLGDFSTAKVHVPVCNFCEHLGRCPRVREHALHIAKKFDPISFPESVTPTSVLAPDQTSLCLKLASLMKTWSDAFKRRVADRVIRGDAEMPPGYVWHESEGNRKIVDAEKFKEVALRHIPEDDLKKCAQYGFGDIEELISDRAPRGTKGAAIEKFKAELEASGAVQKGEPFSYLKVKSGEKS